MQAEFQPALSEQPTTTAEPPNTQQPAPVEYLVPTLQRPFTEAERTALRRFIALLPVSPQLDSKALSIMHSFVAPFYQCGQPETIVTEEAIQHRVNGEAERIQCQVSLAHVHQVVERIFADSNTLIIGQLQVERDSATNSLVLRVNAENHNALLDFIIMLVGEDLI